MKRFFLLFFICFFISLFFINYTTYCEESEFEYKDPVFAAALSWYVPGLGFMYTGNWLKGSIYFVTESLLFWYSFSQVANIKFSIDQIISFNFNLNSKDEELANENLYKASIAISLFGVIRIVSIVDSMLSSVSYNQKYSENLYTSTKSPFIASLLSWLYPGLGQFYLKQYYEGSVYLALDLIQKIYLVSLMFSNFPIDTVLEEDATKINWENMDSKSKFLIVSYLSLYIGNRVFSAYRAYTIKNNINSTSTVVLKPYFGIVENGFDIGLSLKL